MNSEESRLILQCRRPCGRDDKDPIISEALAALSGDTALMAAMKREAALDSVISERLRSVEPPADLRRRILIGAKVSRPVRWWQRPVWLAAAAAIAIMVPLTAKYWPGAVTGGPVFALITLAEFRAATTQKLQEGPKLQQRGNIDEVRTHLAGRSKGKPVPVPENLCRCPGGAIGCEIFEWRGREVTLICFDAGKSGTVHLFTVDASALEDRPGGPIYQPSNGWQTRAWVNDGRLMVLAASEKAASPRDLELLAANDR